MIDKTVITAAADGLSPSFLFNYRPDPTMSNIWSQPDSDVNVDAT